VSQWHVPYESYLAPFVYPDLSTAGGRGPGAAETVPDARRQALPCPQPQGELRRCRQ